MRNHCACNFDEDGETTLEWCGHHADMRKRLEELEREKVAANKLAANAIARYATLVESKACSVCKKEAEDWLTREMTAQAPQEQESGE